MSIELKRWTMNKVFEVYAKPMFDGEILTEKYIKSFSRKHDLAISDEEMRGRHF